MTIQRIREPYSKEELEASYDEDIIYAIEHLGEDHPEILQLKDKKTKNMIDFGLGKVVLVFSRDWFGTKQYFYSDGTMHSEKIVQ